MRAVLLWLACSTCSGQTRRVEMTAQQLQGRPHEEHEIAQSGFQHNGDAKSRLNSAQSLKKLLLAHNAASAFNPPSNGVGLPQQKPAVSTHSQAPLRLDTQILDHLSERESSPSIVTRTAPAMSVGTAQQELDSDALVRYVGAIGLQIACLAAAFGLVDKATDLVTGGGSLPWQAVTAVFFLLSLRSRLFSPLDNSRPDLQKSTAGEKTGGFNDRIMPSWTPPGVVFPIMWVLIVAPLRAYSSTLVWEAHGGHLLDPTLLCLMLHLSVGDTWNTINNVERRIGAAVPGVLCVWLSVLFATTQYFQADPFAGQLLAVTAVWITVAGTLIADTWRLNNEVSPEPLYPYKSSGVATRFWFES